MIFFVLLFVIEKNKLDDKQPKQETKINYDDLLKKLEINKKKFEEENKIKIKNGTYIRDVLGLSLKNFFDINLAYFYQTYLYKKNKIRNASVEYILFHNIIEELKNGVGYFL